MKARFFLTSDSLSVASLAVQIPTGSAYGHTGIVFYEGAHPVYFESIWKRDPNSGKNGVRGPRPAEWLDAWQQQAEHTRRLLLLPGPGDGYLPWTDEEAETAYRLCCKAAHTVGYAKLQIPQNLLAITTGLQISYRSKGATRYTCSELVLRVTPPRFWPYFEVPTYTADFIAPAGNRLPSIETGTARMLAAHPARL